MYLGQLEVVDDAVDELVVIVVVVVVIDVVPGLCLKLLMMLWMNWLLSSFEKVRRPVSLNYFLLSTNKDSV